MTENFTPINFTPLNIEETRKKAERHELIVDLFLLLVNLTLVIIVVTLGFLIKKNLGW